MAKATFEVRRIDPDATPRRQMRVPVRLTLEENRFCLDQSGQSHLASDEGGAGPVDQYLARLCYAALREEMRRAGVTA